jgi:quinol monooxygenase YgiN
MICVIAAIDVAEGRRDEFLAIFRKLLPTVRAEAGCLEYGPMVDFPAGTAGQQPVRPNTVTVVEKWQSPAALEAHLATPHMRQFFAATERLRTGLVLQILQPA